MIDNSHISELLKDFQIPDSFEPIVGWKTLNLDKLMGKLYSPSYPMVWEPREQAEAFCCSSAHGIWKWTPIKDGIPKVPAPPVIGPTLAHSSYYATTTPPIYMTNTHQWATDPTAPNEPPNIILPNGWDWSFEFVEIEHDCPSNSCSCGIYLASDKDVAANYHGDVLVEMYGWGKVIEHTNGWRVQYAYPKEIYVGNKEETEEHGLNSYGVAVTLASNVKKFPPPTAKQKHMYLGDAFFLAFLLLISAAVAIMVIYALTVITRNLLS